MRAHWPSEVKPEWQVGLAEYPALAEKAFQDFTVAQTKNRHFIRIAGPSGSGKTTQILPAVEAYCEKQNLSPILIAARKFVEYHPHYQEIKDFYGDANLRKMTDEFSTIMLFMVISKLIAGGFDIVLDVTLLDASMETILQNLLAAGNYQQLLLMISASPAVTDHYLGGRSWRHTKEAEQEFIRATSGALEFYAKTVPDLRIIIWSVYDKEPVYDGPVRACLDVFKKYAEDPTLPAADDDARRDAKIRYLASLAE